MLRADRAWDNQRGEGGGGSHGPGSQTGEGATTEDLENQIEDFGLELGFVDINIFKHNTSLSLAGVDRNPVSLEMAFPFAVIQGPGHCLVSMLPSPHHPSLIVVCF